MLVAGVIGMLSGFFFLTVKTNIFLAAILLLCANLSVAIPDVMIDGSTGEAANSHPHLASEVQTMINAAYQGCAFIGEVAVGYLIAPDVIGSRGVFGCFALTALLGTIIPTSLGWMGETREPNPGTIDVCYSQQRLLEVSLAQKERRTLRDAKSANGKKTLSNNPMTSAQEIVAKDDMYNDVVIAKTAEEIAQDEEDLAVGARARKPVFRAAMANVVVSLILGFMQVFYRADDADWVNGILTAILGAALAIYIYVGLREVSVELAGAAVFIFMEGVFSPSANIVFQWSHDDAKENGNCARHCDDDTDEDECGWARDRHYPCISPEWWGWARSVSRLFGFLGVLLYQVGFSHWKYRHIFALGTFLYFIGNMLDLIWVSRINQSLNISDEFFLFGVEIIQPVMKRIRIMPVFVLCAKLCPKSVEATLFALLMGLINLGSAIGKYNAVALLNMFGGVEAPDFRHIEGFIFVRTLMYLVPLVFIPFFAPPGGPRDEVRNGRTIEGSLEGSLDDIDKALKATNSDIEMTSTSSTEHKEEHHHQQQQHNHPVPPIEMDLV